MTTLSRIDSIALWHAVRAYSDQVKAMATMDLPPQLVEGERLRLAAAQRALRKVQAGVREQRKARKAAAG